MNRCGGAPHQSSGLRETRRAARNRAPTASLQVPSRETFPQGKTGALSYTPSPHYGAPVPAVRAGFPWGKLSPEATDEGR